MTSIRVENVSLGQLFRGLAGREKINCAKYTRWNLRKRSFSFLKKEK